MLGDIFLKGESNGLMALIGVSLSEPHSGQTASPQCLYVGMYLCIVRHSVNALAF